MRYYPGIACCRKGRVCHAEPKRDRGALTTGPVVLTGKSLVLNALAKQSGSVRVEILDDDGQPIPGFDREACQPLKGDSTGHIMRWKDRQLSELAEKPVRLRFLLDRARLFSYHVQ